MSKEKITIGIKRRIDDLGRIVIPKEIRKHLHITEGDEVDITLVGDYVSIKKPSERCTFCNTLLSEEQLKSQFRICNECKDKIANLPKAE